jgi:pyrroline-5-carboxylate reductase
MTSSIGFIGAGNMAQAIISGLIHGNALEARNIFVSDVQTDTLQHLNYRFGVAICANNQELIEQSDVVILAVKPQVIIDVVQSLSLSQSRLFVSIAAGVHSASLTPFIGERLIRVMPNTPALVGEGISAIYPGNVSSQDIAMVTNIFQHVGETVLVSDEQQMHAVTALSGSGPAYGYYILDALTQAGTRLGLSPELSRKLACHTIKGAATMGLEADVDFAELIRRVTSPGGTTEQGMNILTSSEIKGVLYDTLNAAHERSMELEK